MPVSLSMVPSNDWALKDRIERMCMFLHQVSSKSETLDQLWTEQGCQVLYLNRNIYIERLNKDQAFMHCTG